MRTVVTFRTARFNTTKTLENFINPCCYGEDLCNWLIDGLTEAGFECAEPDQEDFGWYFNFETPDGQYCFVCGARSEDGEEPPVWIGWVERNSGVVASLFGARNKNIAASATGAIHALLAASPDISEIRWHEKYDFDAGDEESGADTPE